MDAYPDIVFRDAEIDQIRISPTVSQNVVTYPVIVATTNPDLKLLPGMTANLTFQVSELKNILKIPNEALRFNPEKAMVREVDQKYLELFVAQDDKDNAATSSLTAPVDESVAAAKAATRRIVWVRETQSESAEAARLKQSAEGSATAASSAAIVDAPAAVVSTAETPAGAPAGSGEVQYSGKLRAVEVMIGDSDYQFTHVTGGGLQSGDEVVTGIKPPEAP